MADDGILLLLGAILRYSFISLSFDLVYAQNCNGCLAECTCGFLVLRFHVLWGSVDFSLLLLEYYLFFFEYGACDTSSSKKKYLVFLKSTLRYLVDCSTQRILSSKEERLFSSLIVLTLGR